MSKKPQTPQEELAYHLAALAAIEQKNERFLGWAEEHWPEFMEEAGLPGAVEEWQARQLTDEQVDEALLEYEEFEKQMQKVAAFVMRRPVPSPDDPGYKQYWHKVHDRVDELIAEIGHEGYHALFFEEPK